MLRKSKRRSDPQRPKTSRHHLLFPESQYTSRIAQIRASWLDEAAKDRIVKAINGMHNLFVVDMLHEDHLAINERALLPDGYRAEYDILPSNRVYLELWASCKYRKSKIAKKRATSKIDVILSAIGRMSTTPEDNVYWLVSCLKRQRKFFMKLEKRSPKPRGGKGRGGNQEWP